MNLADLGWTTFWEDQFRPWADGELLPARIARAGSRLHAAWCEHGEILAEVSGRFRHEAPGPGAFPVTGDWVAAAPQAGGGRAIIHAVVPRRTRLSRKAAGPKPEEQVLAANMDVAFLVGALDGGRNANLRRLERWLTVAWDSGAQPVVVLNKADLCAEIELVTREVEAVAGGAPILVTSAADGQGLDVLREHVPTGRTAVLLGASGVGKSALINRLLESAAQDTAPVRAKDLRGRHTTTAREMFLVPRGGILIDTPGLRELALWVDNQGLAGAFPEIDVLAERCRFRDCRHEGEPGCAVQEALSIGALAVDRFENYVQLRRELAYLERKTDFRAQQAEKAKSKQISKWIKRIERDDKHR